MAGDRREGEERIQGPDERDLTDGRSAACVAALSGGYFMAFIPLEMPSNFPCPAVGG